MNTRLLAAISCAVVLTACAADPDAAGPTLRLSSGGATAAMAESASVAPGVETAMPEPWYGPTFELDEGLRSTTLPTSALGYRSVVDLDASSVAKLALVLNITSEVSEDEYGFTVEQADADGLRSSLYMDRTGNWWYTAYDQDLACVPSVEPPAPDQTTPGAVVSCSKSRRPAGSMSEADARVTAGEVFAASGAANLPLEVTVLPDTGFGESVHVHGIETVGGYKTGRTFEVAFTAGRLAWASGTIAELVELGRYDLVGIDALESRVKDHRYTTWGAYDPQYWLEAASIAEPARESAMGDVGTPVPSPTDGATTSGLDASTATEPAATPLDELEVVLGVFLQEGEMLYLPSYHLTGPTGSMWTVLAVVDGVIEFTEPATEPPMIEPLPLPVVDFDPTVVVGRPEQTAFDVIEEAGLSVRIVARDGEEFAVTMDYLPNRVNLSVADGVVVDATIG